MPGKKFILKINSLVSDSTSEPIKPFTCVVSLTPLWSCDFRCSYKGEGVVAGSLQDVWRCLKPEPNGLRVKWDDNVKKFELLQQISEVWQVFFFPPSAVSFFFHSILLWIWALIFQGLVVMTCRYANMNCGRMFFLTSFSFFPPGDVRLQNSYTLSSNGHYLSTRLCGCYFS